MKKSFYAFVFWGLLISLCPRPVFSQTITFQKTYRWDGYAVGIRALELSDGYLIAGSTYDSGTVSKGLLLRTDLYGEIVWQKTYSNGVHEILYDVKKANDGGFVALGETKIDSTNNYDIWLIKTDVNGNLLWQKNLGQANRQEGGSANILPINDGYIISGYSYQVGSDLERGFLTRLDNMGNAKWSWANYTNVAGSTYNNAEFILHDSIYIAGGGRFSPAFWMVRDTATGLYGSVSKFEGDNAEAFMGICPAQSGGVVTCGRVRPAVPEDYETLFWVQKHADPKTVVWSKTYVIPGWEALYIRISDCADGGSILTLINSLGRSALVKIDGDGQVKWAKTYTETWRSGLNKVEETADGGFITVGYRDSTAFNFGQDLLFIKTDAQGEIAQCCSINLPVIVSDFAVPALADSEMTVYPYTGTDERPLGSTENGPLQQYEYCESPRTTLQESAQICEGQSYTINGVNYTESVEVAFTTHSNTSDCDTLHHYSLEVLPIPHTFDTLLFLPGESVLLNGITYSQPGTVTFTLPSTTGGCDTLATYFLDYLSGVATPDFATTWRLFPNPAAPSDLLRLEGGHFQSATLAFYDAAGRFMATAPVRGNRVGALSTALPSGLYFFVVLENGRRLGMGRFVVF